MIWVPQYRIARFVITRIVKFMGADASFHLIFKAIFLNLPSLIFTFGVIPVLRVIYQLSRYATKGIKFEDLPLNTALFLSKYNPIIIRTILDAISPYWNTCLKNPVLFKSLFKVFMSFYSLGIMRPLLGQTFRLSVGIILSSIGIAFNEVLYSISLLKQGADFVLDFLPLDSIKNLINLKKEIGSENIKPEIIKETLNNNSSLLSLIGLFFLGLGTFVGILCIGDYLSPDTFGNIPVVQTILDPVYSFGDWIKSWFITPDTLDKGKGRAMDEFVEETVREKNAMKDIMEKLNKMSRSSSGSDTVTPTTPTTPKASGSGSQPFLPTDDFSGTSW